MNLYLSRFLENQVMHPRRLCLLCSLEDLLCLRRLNSLKSMRSSTHCLKIQFIRSILSLKRLSLMGSKLPRQERLDIHKEIMDRIFWHMTQCLKCISSWLKLFQQLGLMPRNTRESPSELDMTQQIISKLKEASMI